jgi:heme O synthase-like polyprenyltransferase
MVRTSSRPNNRNPVYGRDILFCATIFALNGMSLQLYLYALGAMALTRIHEVGLKQMQPLLF